jgi:hypothetical protein
MEIVVIILLVVLIAILWKKYLYPNSDKFVSIEAQKIYTAAKEIFDDEGENATYTNYKKLVPRADPVQYSDIRDLYRTGKLTPITTAGVI